MRFTHPLVPLLALAFASCTPTPPSPPSFPVTPREAGDRAPLTAPCDPLDELHCLLPWPSSAFLRADPSSPTGVRVDVSAASLNRDDVANAWGADGFSRATTVMTGLYGAIDPDTVEHVGGGPEAVLRLFVASPGSPRFGEEIPMRLETRIDLRGERARSLVVGDPLEYLDPATDYVVVLSDAARDTDGMPFSNAHVDRVALGLDEPQSEEEAALAGYHAPTVALLERVGIDPSHTLRAWDFTTRSVDDGRRILLAMRDASVAAYDRGEIRFVIDSVQHRESGAVASVVLGHMEGLPNFLDGANELTLDEGGLPIRQGDGQAPFRITIPRGEGDYRTVLYGHGAGGDVNDSTFDGPLAEEGVAKLGMEFTGFHEAALFDTIADLSPHVLIGARHAVTPLLQVMARAVVLEHAVHGALGDLLSAETLGGRENPHAGRRPGRDGVQWVGGSLGGISGLVITSISPAIQNAVLNVPACGWSHWLENSAFYLIAQAGVQRKNGGPIGAAIAVSMAQLDIDALDGATYAELAREDGDVFLVQESMGDELVPNAGTEFLAIVTGAVMVGEPLSPIVGVEAIAGDAVDRTAITQFRAEGREVSDVHGFAANDRMPSGQAAIEQIRLFLTSSWEGASIIRVPSQCAGGRCDFRP